MEKTIGMQLAEEMLKIYPDAKTITCKLMYEKEINEYIKSIEDAHKAAANSTLVFK